MKVSFKNLVITSCIFVFISCKKESNQGSSSISACKFNKIIIYQPIIPSGTAETDYFFYNTGNFLTQITVGGVSGSESGREDLYYTNDKLFQIKSYDVNSGIESLSDSTNISYSGENISAIDVYERIGTMDTDMFLSYRIEYNYDGNGRRIKKITKQADIGFPVEITATYDYTYDGLGNIIKIVGKDQTNTIVQTNTFEYNNHLNDLTLYHKQLDVFGFLFFDGTIEVIGEEGLNDEKYLSKYQVITENVNEYGSSWINHYQYRYDNVGKTIEVTSDADLITRTDIEYNCN